MREIGGSRWHCNLSLRYQLELFGRGALVPGSGPSINNVNSTIISLETSCLLICIWNILSNPSIPDSSREILLTIETWIAMDELKIDWNERYLWIGPLPKNSVRPLRFASSCPQTSHLFVEVIIINHQRARLSTWVTAFFFYFFFYFEFASMVLHLCVWCSPS